MSGWLDARFGLRSLFFTFLAQAVALAGLFVVGSAMPAALVFVMVIALLMYLVSIPSVSNFMRVSRERHPKALTLASSLEPLSFNVGISFGTLVGGAVVSGPGITPSASWARCSRSWPPRWSPSRCAWDAGAGSRGRVICSRFAIAISPEN